jgi:hypothetical protein
MLICYCCYPTDKVSILPIAFRLGKKKLRQIKNPKRTAHPLLLMGEKPKRKKDRNRELNTILTLQ